MKLHGLNDKKVLWDFLKKNVNSKNVSILVDLSGSMNMDNTRHILDSIVDYLKSNNANGEIAFWTKTKEADCSIYNYDRNWAYFPGGTDVAKGINDFYKTKAVVAPNQLIIISDYDDDLNSWAKELRKYRKAVGFKAIGISINSPSVGTTYKNPQDFYKKMAYPFKTKEINENCIARAISNNITTYFVEGTY